MSTLNVIVLPAGVKQSEKPASKWPNESAVSRSECLRQRCQLIAQEVADGEGDSRNQIRRQKRVGDAAVGKPVFQEAAEGEADFVDGTGGGVDVGKLGTQDSQTQRHRVSSSYD